MRPSPASASGSGNLPEVVRPDGLPPGDTVRSTREDLREAERSGFRLQLKVRAAVLSLVAAWFLGTATIERALIYAAFCGSMVLVGWIVDRFVVRSPAGRWKFPAAALILLDVTTLSVVLAVPGLIQAHPWPPQMALRFFSFLYLPLYVMGSALTTSPLLVLWTGASVTVAWSACVWWVLQRPGTITVGSVRMIDTDLPMTDQLGLWLDPHFVSVIAYETQVLVLLLGSAVLALGVWRGRRVLVERTSIAGERRNLARFLPADLADDLAAGPALGDVRRQRVTVMFADVVGFTAMAERLEPEAALAILGEFHGRMTSVVSAHGGTVDKFIGDAVMVTFGASRTALLNHATLGLSCALAAVDAVAAWNVERRRRGEEELQVGIGVHCGEVLVGTVGAKERLEHTVIGDVVNVANRLERLTRVHGTQLVASEAMFANAERAGGRFPGAARFSSTRTFEIRGRSGTIDGRALRRDAYGMSE